MHIETPHLNNILRYWAFLLHKVGDKMNYSMKLKFYKDGPAFFGPGVALLMRAVEQTGSLRAAAQQMNMAYSKAWRILRTAEESLGFALVERQHGGQGGGGSVITEEGALFLDTYNQFVAAAETAVTELFLEYFDGYTSKEQSGAK